MDRRERQTRSYPPPCGEGGERSKPGGGRAGIHCWTPTPNPSPSPLRACPLPANLEVTKPWQAGVWLGRGADRVSGMQQTVLRLLLVAAGARDFILQDLPDVELEAAEFRRCRQRHQ